jgi:uncharacterized protein
VVSNSHHQSFVNRRVLRVNVGYLLAQGAGYQRTFELDLPRVQVADDTELDFLKGSLRLSRNSRGILVQGTLATHVITECSRCLTPISVPVDLELEELFSYPPSADVPYSVEETGFLDLAPLLREEVILAVPMGALCREDCAGLCPECGQNWNEGSCDCEQDTGAPRLVMLRDQLEIQEPPDDD